MEVSQHQQSAQNVTDVSGQPQETERTALSLKTKKLRLDQGKQFAQRHLASS